MGSSSSNAREAAAAAPPPPPPPPAVPPAPLHAMDADEDDESVKQLNECAALYLSLQDCLAESDRNWKACQAHVQALKACEASRNKNQET
ncbi:hypothetical protein CFC21_007380 [Triticum aestivum]|uniref:CHCH domain-containing protein n=2 Tax=Triticum aestivum TaxID=4565 RepID=A0A9R1DE20_WHEAT|nr:uncharacterized protein LOC123132446 [Triticum aestivum]KAF6990143.1 hypothetical protein CFC21_007380 [Triticum aestivum]